MHEQLLAEVVIGQAHRGCTSKKQLVGQAAGLTAEVERLLGHTATLEAENADLKRQLHATQDEAKALRSECGALRSLLMSSNGSSGGAATATAASDAAAPSAGAEDAHAARREAELLKQENARLARLLAEATGSGAHVAMSRSSTVGGGSTSNLLRAASDARMHHVVSDPAREKEVFAAAGFNTETRQYVTPNVQRLHDAIAKGGVNVNCRDGLGNPPLSHAAWLGAEDLIIELIMHGADMDAENLDGATPLHYCIFADQLKAAALLIAAGADPTVAEDDAGSMGKDGIRSLFRAACDEEEHPALTEARHKFERITRR